MRECQAARRFGVTIREYRELEAGERFPDFDTWHRICKLLNRNASVAQKNEALHAPRIRLCLVRL